MSLAIDWADEAPEILLRSPAHQVENQLLGHLKDHWGKRCQISWANCNVKFTPTKSRKTYTDNTTVLIPRLTQVYGEYLEYPPLEGARSYRYQFFLNLLTTPNSGMGHVQEHVANLQELYELKSLVFGETQTDFDVLQTKSGFLTSGGDQWETPVSVMFTAIL